MNIRFLALALAVSAAAFTPALAEQARTAKPEAAAASGAAASTAGEAGAAAQARKICRKEGATGSRTAGARICLTKDEWRRVDRGEEVTILRERSTSRR